jgi:lysozyme
MPIKKQAKKLPTWLPVVLLLCILVALFFLPEKEEPYRDWNYENNYPNFGVYLPKGFAIHGIDVSKYQGRISWPNVATMTIDNVNMGFVFIKATEGLKDVDKNFKRNYDSASAAGLICGAYHFFLPTKDGVAQAKHFIATAKLQKGNLRPVIDVEQRYGVPTAVMQKRLKDCLQHLEKHYQQKPIIYSYVDFYKNYLGKSFDDYPLWIAHYLEPNKPRIERQWHFWQHSEKGLVNGITTNVDCNVFNGDSAAFKALLLR